ncbi:putative FKBP-type peptidyl-prolyl cis-trans isomerase [Metallosphaera sp. J1]|uniref:peptidylprolyl isomerase n=1 Tax=Metallosphaera javensis (ex Hofmann et al. 2022) TaxID=99938 RepID=UPI001EDD0A76|nr:FKBP-type peptidyl-prolyl cis-trans isomerase [Metallosphaera javensis (ex Hofmann et al. 2022)]MCG3107904.1 putative FKBP-type peptidyl-prolyl cis-trans isomerase [Metallosphaera javensis (ex Hofmann et al. 2022)]
MFKEKDFIYIDYTGKVKNTGEVVDTTIEEEAKKANIYSEDKKYEPQLVILGEHRLIKGLEDSLYNFELNEEREIEIPPENAYGQRDPSKVKVMSLGEVRKQGITPYPGMPVRFSDGSVGTIKSVSGGRVYIDLNHPLAGKTLVYKVKVVKQVTDVKEKIQALIKRWFGGVEMPAPELLEDQKTLKIIIPEKIFLLEDLQTRKLLLARDIIKYVLDDVVVVYQESYTKAFITQ